MNVKKLRTFLLIPFRSARVDRYGDWFDLVPSANAVSSCWNSMPKFSESAFMLQYLGMKIHTKYVASSITICTMTSIFIHCWLEQTKRGQVHLCFPFERKEIFLPPSLGVFLHMSEFPRWFLLMLIDRLHWRRCSEWLPMQHIRPKFSSRWRSQRCTHWARPSSFKAASISFIVRFLLSI